MTISPEVFEASIKPGLRSGQVVRLLPRHSIFLFVYAGDGMRFARLFKETWTKVPLSARRRMLKHWKCETTSHLAVQPTIELMGFWSGRVDEGGLRGTKAAVGTFGCRMTFCSLIVDAYPDELVRDLVAHELAHVVQISSNYFDRNSTVFERELDADEKVEEWGFSSTAMDEWDQQNGVSPTYDVAKMTGEERMRLEEMASEHLKNHGR